MKRLLLPSSAFVRAARRMLKKQPAAAAVQSGADAAHGVELWRSDGTRVGTYLLKDLVP